jgi:peptidoglycan/xylan/chitin deacetylase (PgdA/CDA1 family)
MNLVHSSWLGRWFGRDVVCRVEGIHDRFALTFDDGPSPTQTPRVLEVLARHNARATFFMLAPHARRHAALVRAVHEAGHEIGVHGRDHVPPVLLTPGQLRRQIDDTAAAVRDACGERPGCYRAPFGMLRRSQARFVRQLGYVPVLGDIYPEDPHEPRADRIAGTTLRRLRPGSIVILHDSSVFGDASRSRTIEAVDRILAASAVAGLRAVSVRDMLPAAAPA